jgi:hypothetical protein
MSKTVRVRIAVCVDDKGAWSAFGCNDRDDKYRSEVARDNHCPDHHITSEQLHFVEADIPLPEPATVEGSVTGQGGGGEGMSCQL